LTRIYFDSSAYVKIFAPEGGTEEASLLFQLAFDGRVEIYMSAWTINETIAAIDRKHRRKEISDNERAKTLATIIRHAIDQSERSSAVSFIPIDQEIVDKSRDLIMAKHLSADDALHLYTAFAKDCQYFIHHDEKLKKYVGAMIDGLSLVDIAQHREIHPLVKSL
jgi:predicted nucleic acid-binding protein